MDITIDCESLSVEWTSQGRGSQGRGRRMLRVTLLNVDKDDFKIYDDDILDVIGRERAIEYFKITEAE